MTRALCLILLLVVCLRVQAQQSFAFSHMTTDDGIGLASNLVTCIYQDPKGYMWVGTANGLQRFDGSKFVEINTRRLGNDNLLHSRLSQIIPADNGQLLLASFTLRTVGMFDPVKLTYTKVTIRPLKPISPTSEFRLWRDSTVRYF